MATVSNLLSPELVLVDPELDVHPRVPLALPTKARSRRLEPAAPNRDPLYGAPSERGNDALSEARKRLMEAGLHSDVLGSLVPPRKDSRSRARLIPAGAAATSVALLVLQLYLGQGQL